MTYHLVLIGGGHSHAIALKLWGMNPLPEVRLILITETAHTPYSGMLPGHVAGFYTFDETHIDLRRLAQFAQAQFYLDQAIGLDLTNHQVICQNHPPIPFDYLSIDIGSTPTTNHVPGASKYTIPAKPVSQFLQAWNHLIQGVSHDPKKSYDISIVGGGAGGVELALNIHSRLQLILKKANLPLDNLKIHLFHRGQTLLSVQNNWVSKRLKNILLERGIHIHLQERVSEISPNSDRSYQIHCESGLKINSNVIFWVTQASAPQWVQASGLKTDQRGFILVNDYLQSVSHPYIFAAGDIATMQNYSRPKAGVFAVRQGKPLFNNLQKIISAKPLKPYIPQKYYLSLIGTGDQRAIASWACLSWEGSWVWYWKDDIDRRFMESFIDLSFK